MIKAVIILKEEVQNNNLNAEAWTLLGQLYQQMDQDDCAIIAFKQSFKLY